MSTTSPTGSDVTKKPCTTFEPQQWRRTVCKNCYRTQDRHVTEADETPPHGDAEPAAAESGREVDEQIIPASYGPASFASPLPRAVESTDGPGGTGVAPLSRVFVAGGPRTARESVVGGPSSIDMEDGTTIGGKLDRVSVVSGQPDSVNSLRDKVSVLDERNAQLDREKSALAELLSAKKREYDQMRQHYRDRVSELEDETQRLKAEKLRLVEKLQLPESERASLVAQENEIAKLRRRLDDSEARCAEILDENVELKREVKDLQLEIEEMHDQFRDEETAEFRELQRELESTAKACRIVNFKLRKAERRCDQLEAERVQADEKIRQLEARFRTSDDRQHILELEEELRMAKEVSVRLHDDVEAVEEKRARYEEELDRVNDLLTESESRRQALQKEVDMLIDQLKRYQPGSPGGTHTLDVPKLTSSTTLTKQGSQDIDVAQLMRDLNDSLERENDLREQLRFSEEETKVMRKKLSDVEDENESLTMQLHKLSTAKSGRFVPTLRRSADGQVETSEASGEREQELRLQMELAEQEVKVLRRKQDDMERSYDILLEEVRQMRVRVDGSRDSLQQQAAGSGAGHDDDGGQTSDEKIQEMVRDIERLKWKLLEKDKDADKVPHPSPGRRTGSSSMLQKSRSLEEPTTPGGGGVGDPHHTYTEFHFDLRMQLDTVQQEARVLQDKLSETQRANEQLTTENKKLQILAGRTSSSAAAGTSKAGAAGKHDEEAAKTKMIELEAENAALRERVSQLDERTNALSKEIVRAKFRGQQQVELGLAGSPGSSASGAESAEASTAWRELRAQVQFLDDECRNLRRKVVDLEAEKSRLGLQLTHATGNTDPKHKDRIQELDKESKEELTKRILELENELADMTNVVRNREEDAERLADEVADNRDDLNRMLDSFRRRERELLDDVESLQHKNATLSDLLELVTERAESTQKELDRYRSSGSDVIGDAIAGPGTPTVTDPSVQKEWERRVSGLERQLAEERKRVQAAEKKLKMVDVPLSEVKDDTRLRQHEKEILVQELALCQKQLSAANEQISDLKQRLLAIRESHDDIKEDFAKVSKELAEVRQQSLSAAGRGSAAGRTPAAVRIGAAAIGKLDREPASWRWEKQELERQLKEHKKKLDDIYSEMKRNQVKWKAAGEDIARETQIKEELEKKIDKLREQGEAYKLDAEQNKNKVEELEETLKRQEKQWDKERQMMEADKMAAENDARQKDDVIRSKDELIAQKNQLVAEKDAALQDRHEALQQKEQQIQQKDVELEFKERELRMRTDEVSTFRSELSEFRAHLAERDERIRQLDEHVRRRDDRLKEKDDILQQINRRLVEKANQVSDMDKTIRQVIRKLQARDVDLGLCNAELRRVQAELKNSQERLGEMKRYADALESDTKRQIADHQSRLQALSVQLDDVESEKSTLSEKLDRSEQQRKVEEEKWKLDIDKLQVELKQTVERLHVQDVSKSMSQSDGMRLLMREKEALIAEKYKLTENVASLTRQLKTAEDKRKTDKEMFERMIEDKVKTINDVTAARDKHQAEIAKLKVSGVATVNGTSGDASSNGSAAPDSTVPRSELERRERQWLAEKATLDEFYETSARNQRDAVMQLREAASALRRENDVQLQLLQGARKALTDLRKRFDLAAAGWNEERARLQTAAESAGRTSERTVELERSVDSLTSELQASEARRKEVENRLMTMEASWKLERQELEEKAKKASETATETKPSSSSSSSSASTRVAEFRSRFEKFGSSKSRKSIDLPTEQRKTEMDAVELSRELQRQLAELEQTRAEERKQLLERLDQQRTVLETENKGLKERNAELEKKARELLHTQRSVVDLQCRLVEDRNQWQLEVSQLQRRLEESQRARIQQKEAVSQLLAEIARLRVLIGALDSSVGGGQTDSLKPRLRSLTPSAEKLRVSNLGQTGARTGTANGTTETNKDDDGARRAFDQTALHDLTQAIEVTSRLAEELSQPLQTPRPDQQRSQQATFRRSLSSAEVEIAASHAFAPPPADSLLFPSTASAHYAAAPRAAAASGRRTGIVRSSSQDEAESSSSSGYATGSIDRAYRRAAPARSRRTRRRRRA